MNRSVRFFVAMGLLSAILGVCGQGISAGAAPTQPPVTPPTPVTPTANPVQTTPTPASPTRPQVIPAAPPAPPAAPVAPLPQPIVVPPPVVKPPYLAFPNLPSIPLNEGDDGVGIAQSLTRTRGLQARMLWVDATANIDRYNTAAKVASLTSQIKTAGFNTVVFDVKPIIGYTVYPSRYAPKLTDWVRPWKTQTLPLDFDPLAEMVSDAHAQGLSLIVNFNAFSEGHREFGKGPGYDHPAWQTTLYEMDLRVRRDMSGTQSYAVTDRANIPPRSPDDLSLYTDLTKLPGNADALVALLDANGNVLLVSTPPSIKALGIKLTTGGAALVGVTPQSESWLRLNAVPGYRLTMDAAPAFVPISQRPERQVPLMTNPNNPEVRQRILDMLTEVSTKYAIDGVVFDDRLRYASLNADFSDITRRQFEQFLASAGTSVVPPAGTSPAAPTTPAMGTPPAGTPATAPMGTMPAAATAASPAKSQAKTAPALRWPDDVFHYSVDFPTLERTVIPGPYFDAWLTFRALTLRNFVADAVRTVKTARPTARVGTYVGSWYPDYPDLGANWGADDLQAGFHFLNDSYRQTGWAGLVDFAVTGCYYSTATILEAQTQGIPAGQSVEAAGQFSNRAVNDQTFVYAGISLDQFKGKPDALRRVLQAAAATTQGIMCFDLSHDIDPLWSIFAEAFAPKPAQAPHQIPGLVDQLRAQHAAQKAANVPTPAVILYRGASGTGF